MVFVDRKHKRHVSSESISKLEALQGANIIDGNFEESLLAHPGGAMDQGLRQLRPTPRWNLAISKSRQSSMKSTLLF